MNYKIINDEEKLIEFINWLPDLKENEVFYLSLFARKKYCSELIKSNDKSQLKRFIANKGNMLFKIKQLELPLGLYQLKNGDVPQESLVLYIHPTPRCMKKANTLMGKKCWDLKDSSHFNLAAEAMSCIQKSKIKNGFVTFDIDFKEGIDLRKIRHILPIRIKNNVDIYNIIETRGGYHILINSKFASFYNSNWYKQIIETFPVDTQSGTGDKMSPMPGTVQSKFIPRLLF